MYVLNMYAIIETKKTNFCIPIVRQWIHEGRGMSLHSSLNLHVKLKNMILLNKNFLQAVLHSDKTRPNVNAKSAIKMCPFRSSDM